MCRLLPSCHTLVLLCVTLHHFDTKWHCRYIPLKPCITLPPKGQSDGNVPEWPLRLSTPPSRLRNIVMDAGKARIQVFKSDQRYWYVIVEGYLRGLGLHRGECSFAMLLKLLAAHHASIGMDKELCHSKYSSGVFV
jgi:hypothetical protein